MNDSATGHVNVTLHGPNERKLGRIDKESNEVTDLTVGHTLIKASVKDIEKAVLNVEQLAIGLGAAAQIEYGKTIHEPKRVAEIKNKSQLHQVHLEISAVKGEEVKEFLWKSIAYSPEKPTEPPGTYGGYNFFGNVCTDFTARVLEVAGISGKVGGFFNAEQLSQKPVGYIINYTQRTISLDISELARSDSLEGSTSENAPSSGGNDFTPDGYEPSSEIFGNRVNRFTSGVAKSPANITEADNQPITEARSSLEHRGRREGVLGAGNIFADPAKVSNPSVLTREVKPNLNSSSENSERRVSDRRSVVGQAPRVPQYQAKLDALATAKPTPPERSPLWLGKSIKNIADAGAYLFEILNSPTPAQLRQIKQPVVYPKFPTSNRDRGEAGGETEALMRLMMPAKEKNRTPFPVPLAEIARVLLQPRP